MRGYRVKTKSGNKPETQEAVEVRLVWDKPAEVPTMYANNLIISHSGSEFYLVFGETEPWLELDSSIIPSELKIKPIVKIAISHKNMLKFAEIIEGNVNQFKEMSTSKEDTK